MNLPEPVEHENDMHIDMFTATQMREYRNAALEEAAKVCEDRDSWQRLPADEEDHECAAAIRNLKEQK